MIRIIPALARGLVIFCLVVFLAGPASAALLTHNLGATSVDDNAGSPNVAISDLTSNPPTFNMTGADSAVTFGLSGSLDSTFVGPGDSYSFTATSFSGTTFNSTTSTVSGGSDLGQIAVRDGFGWGEAGAGAQLEPGEALSLTFDLSGMSSAWLRLTGAVGKQWSKNRAVSEMQIIVNGSEHASVSIQNTNRGDTLSVNGLGLDIRDGDELIFRGAQDGGMIVQSFTLEAIPEPATAALVGIGGLLMLRRRQRA